ncbi:MAG: amino acid adenylation domain-containing protein, partial [bacterium]|nr:amino acid adenylation domain-containing protein [bacterium]
EYYDAGEKEGSRDDIIKNFIRPFELSRKFLLRVRLVKTNPFLTTLRAGEPISHLLLIDMHHIIADGTSIGILASEFIALYQGKTLTPLRIQYKDYTRWQARKKQSEAGKKQEVYWLELYREETPVVDLPYDYNRLRFPTHAGKQTEFRLDTETANALKTFAMERDATIYMVLLSMLTILLSKLSGIEDIVIGTPVVGRRHEDLSSIIGMFVNTMAVRNYPGGEKDLDRFIKEVKENTVKAFENQEYPFEDLLEKITFRGKAGRNPLFDVMFTHQNMGIPRIEIPGLKMEPLPHTSIVSKFDMTFLSEEAGGELLFTVEYSTELFKEETLLRIVNYFKTLIAGVTETRWQKISQVEVIPGEEKRRILFDFNSEASGYPTDKTIHGIFEEQVEKTPDNISVIGPLLQDAMRCALSYRELKKNSRQLAQLLRRKGVKADIIVAVMVERSVEMITCLLAILKAGGAYLPIDPGLPGERIRYMLADSSAAILLTSRQLSNDINYDKEVVYLHELGGKKEADGFNKSNESSVGVQLPPAKKSPLKKRAPVLSDAGASGPLSLAYIIYTSGTTGKPKGVMVEHKSVVSLLFNDKFQFDFNDRDTWSMFHSYSFDFSIWEMYGALLYGGKLLIVPPMVARDQPLFLKLLKENKVTVLNQTPSAFYNLARYQLQRDNKDLNLRYVIFGGEELKPSRLEQWFEKYPGVKLVNMFGITETCVHVTYREIGYEEIEANSCSIGKPIPTLTTYIMDDNRQLLPIGVAGELFVGGDGLARGYLNRPGLTKEKFVSNPYNPTGKLYRSGDLARFAANGDIHYLGRIDHQVQIRGFRIELGEIENRLLMHPDIKDALVKDGNDSDGASYLCAYIVSKPSLPTTTAGNSLLRSYLFEWLPDYMIPNYFVYIETIPLTANGKVNWKKLPAPGICKTGDNYIAPQNAIEKKMAVIWSDVLNVDKGAIGINENFFELGGHSLKATVMVSMVHKTFNVGLSLGEVFQNPTIRGIAGMIKQSSKRRFESIEPVEKKEYYSLSSVQNRLYVLQQMDEANIGYNVTTAALLEGNPDELRLEAVFEELIQRHESLRTSFEVIDGTPVQRIREGVVPCIRYFTVEDQAHSAGSIIRNFIRPFDLGRAPLIRVALIKEETHKQIL